MEQSDIFSPKYQWSPEGRSRADILRSDPAKAKRFLDALSERESRILAHDWRGFWARPKQLPPPTSAVPHELGWQFWVYLAGRGTGKTRLAAEWVKEEILAGRAEHIVLSAPTNAQINKVQLKGESGLYSVFPEWGDIELRRSASNTIKVMRKGRSIAQISLLTGEEPERFRGEQCDLAWFDELAAYSYLEDVWELWAPQLRIGQNPRALFTTTPKPRLLKINLLQNDRTVVTFASSSENANNLPQGYLETLEDVYGDTDFANQELRGVLYLDKSGSLFKSSWIKTHRVHGTVQQSGGHWAVKAPGLDVTLKTIVVAVDPSGSSKDTACECGITLAGLGVDNKGYAFGDLSLRGTPDKWGQAVVDACIKYGATAVYEANYGKEMIPTILRRIAKEQGKTIKMKAVSAQKDKAQRAIIASPFVQKGTMRLVGTHPKLEEQLVLWEPGRDKKSPDRLDAFVWATIDLMMQVPRGNIPSGMFAF